MTDNNGITGIKRERGNSRWVAVEKEKNVSNRRKESGRAKWQKKTNLAVKSGERTPKGEADTFQFAVYILRVNQPSSSIKCT